MSDTTATAVKLRVPGLQDPPHLYIHGEQDRHVSRRLREEGIWEPYETALLMSLLGPGRVFVDVGANIGYFSLIAARLVGDGGAVYAFEPDPLNFRLLQASVASNGFNRRVHAVSAALAAKEGEGLLYLSADNLGDHQIHPADASRPSLPIPLLQGSRYLRQRVQRIDVLKVDTQGAEFEVMRGLMPLLRELPGCPHILIELTPLSLRQCGASGRDLVELLATLGQPMWIVDHIEHRLVVHDPEALAQWCDNVDAVEDDPGFMNILVGPAL